MQVMGARSAVLKAAEVDIIRPLLDSASESGLSDRLLHLQMAELARHFFRESADVNALATMNLMVSSEQQDDRLHRGLQR